MELLPKLKQLEENIQTLTEIRETSDIEKITEQKRHEWELRYGLFESIQIMIDVSCKIANKFNFGNPKNYRECIELLGKNGYIHQDSVSVYTAMIGLRNLLIHEYAEIDAKKLYRYLDSLEDFKRFIQEIRKTLK